LEQIETKTWGQYPSLQDRVVFITGGASGIGKETVYAFVSQHAKVGFLDNNVESGKNLVAELDGKCLFMENDLRDIDSLKQSIANLEEELGAAHVLVNNAANDDRHDWQDVTAEYWDDRMATNLRHQFFAIQSVAPGMIDRGEGSIINLGSNSWWEACGGFPGYATAKSAVHGLTRTMARELGEHGIRVNTVVPGWIMTQRQKDLWVTEEALNKHIQRQCLHTPIDPVYVARMVVFLASGDARMCTASNFMVDGGSI
jgi:NAD(P)-dependent dehydrogenase (short-subunit alcohol dehydrogenase family)